MSQAKFKVGDHVITEVGPCSVMEVLCNNSYVVEHADSGQYLGFKEDEMALIVPKKKYSMDIKIDIASNVVIATLYEMTNDTKSILAKGHGHMIHDGAKGITQAASYACKKLYEALGGTITKGGIWK